MKKYILLLLIMVNSLSFAQVAYEQKTVIDDSFGISGPDEMAVADVNNDGFKDIIVAGSTKIGWFSNNNGSGNFSNCNLITDANSSYHNVVAGDLDGDNDIDIAFSFWGNNIQEFYWCKNLDGLGNFGTPIPIVSGGSFMNDKMQLIDVDADNDLDVLIATGTWLSIFENTNGTGNFTEHVIGGSLTSSSTSIKKFAAKNVDNDPKPEIVSVVNGTLSCYKINADFTLSLLDAITSSPFSDTYDIADINNDGFPDIVTSYTNGTVKKLQWYRNLTGAGSFAAAQNLVTMPSNMSMNGNGNNEKRAIEIVDFDNDNKLDIVHTDSDITDANWYKNMGNGVFVMKQLLISTHQNIRDVKVIDANGDGNKDIVIAVSGENKVAWYNNANGTGVFAAEKIIGSSIIAPNKVDAGDIDNDGDIDLVSASPGDRKVAWYKNTAGGFTEIQNVITQTLINASDATLGDIDNDGDLDVVAFSWYQDNGNFSKIIWYENANGTGNFTQQHIVVSNTDLIQAIELVDIDNDGDKDIISGAENNILSLYKNNGNGTFASAVIFSTFTYNKYLIDMVTADIDNDGDSDVVVSFTSDEIAWYENSNGLGNLSTKHVIVAAMGQPISICVADLDGDNNKEVIFSNRSQSQVGYFKNNGAGIFDTATLLPVTGLLHPSIAFVQDVDNDGDRDLFFNTETGSKLFYLLNDGLAGFSSPYDVYASNYNIYYYKNIPSIVSADFNADGKLDFALAEVVQNKVAWFKNLGLYQNKIKGTIKLDADINGCSETDADIANVLVTTDDGTNSFSTFSQSDGTYELIANEGAFSTTIASPIQNYSSNPLAQSSNFTAAGQTDTVNFCLQPAQLINDLQVTIYPLQQPRPGFNASYKIMLHNNGTNPLSGTVAFAYNNNKFNFISTSQAIQSQTPNVLVFSFDNLVPFRSKEIDVKLQVRTIPDVTIGEVVTFEAQLGGFANDAHPFDNQFALSQTVIGAYDPNDIAVLEGSEVSIDNAGEYLHYIIRFQNTGNSYASRVKVNTILDDKLDFSTMQLETTSHAGKVEITNGNNVNFIFDAIYLPASASNFNASQGFICYKIKPKSNVAIGDIVMGDADIYFDYNPAVETNTVQTQFADLLGIHDDFENKNDVVLYPNPVKNSLSIFTGVTKYKVEVYSQLGQLLYENKDQNTIDFSNYDSGIYIIKIIDDQQNAVSKKIIKL